MLKKILSPVDFSDCSKAALRHAVFLGDRFDAPIHLLHVSHVPGPLRPDLTVWAGNASASLAEHVRQEAAQALEQFVVAAGIKDRPGLTVETASGAPAATIVTKARDGGFDLIVMGTHGRTGISHLVLGSIAENVVRHAQCPVLTVRPEKAAD